MQRNSDPGHARRTATTPRRVIRRLPLRIRIAGGIRSSAPAGKTGALSAVPVPIELEPVTRQATFRPVSAAVVDRKKAAGPWL